MLPSSLVKMMRRRSNLSSSSTFCLLLLFFIYPVLAYSSTLPSFISSYSTTFNVSFSQSSLSAIYPYPIQYSFNEFYRSDWQLLRTDNKFFTDVSSAYFDFNQTITMMTMVEYIPATCGIYQLSDSQRDSFFFRPSLTILSTLESLDLDWDHGWMTYSGDNFLSEYFQLTNLTINDRYQVCQYINAAKQCISAFNSSNSSIPALSLYNMMDFIAFNFSSSSLNYEIVYTNVTIQVIISRENATFSTVEPRVVLITGERRNLTRSSGSYSSSNPAYRKVALQSYSSSVDADSEPSTRHFSTSSSSSSTTNVLSSVALTQPFTVTFEWTSFVSMEPTNLIPSLPSSIECVASSTFMMNYPTPDDNLTDPYFPLVPTDFTISFEVHQTSTTYNATKFPISSQDGVVNSYRWSHDSLNKQDIFQYEDDDLTMHAQLLVPRGPYTTYYNILDNSTSVNCSRMDNSGLWTASLRPHNLRAFLLEANRNRHKYVYIGIAEYNGILAEFFLLRYAFYYGYSYYNFTQLVGFTFTQEEDSNPQLPLILVNEGHIYSPDKSITFEDRYEIYSADISQPPAYFFDPNAFYCPLYYFPTLSDYYSTMVRYTDTLRYYTTSWKESYDGVNDYLRIDGRRSTFGDLEVIKLNQRSERLVRDYDLDLAYLNFPFINWPSNSTCFSFDFTSNSSNNASTEQYSALVSPTFYYYVSLYDSSRWIYDGGRVIDFVTTEVFHYEEFIPLGNFFEHIYVTYYFSSPDSFYPMLFNFTRSLVDSNVTLTIDNSRTIFLTSFVIEFFQFSYRTVNLANQVAQLPTTTSCIPESLESQFYPYFSLPPISSAIITNSSNSTSNQTTATPSLPYIPPSFSALLIMEGTSQRNPFVFYWYVDDEFEVERLEMSRSLNGDVTTAYIFFGNNNTAYDVSNCTSLPLNDSALGKTTTESMEDALRAAETEDDDVPDGDTPDSMQPIYNASYLNPLRSLYSQSLNSFFTGSFSSANFSHHSTIRGIKVNCFIKDYNYYLHNDTRFAYRREACFKVSYWRSLDLDGSLVRIRDSGFENIDIYGKNYTKFFNVMYSFMFHSPIPPSQRLFDISKCPHALIDDDGDGGLPDPTDNQNLDDGNSMSAILGIAVGVGGGVLLTIFLLWCWWTRIDPKEPSTLGSPSMNTNATDNIPSWNQAPWRDEESTFHHADANEPSEISVNSYNRGNTLAMMPMNGYRRGVHNMSSISESSRTLYAPRGFHMNLSTIQQQPPRYSVEMTKTSISKR